MDGLIWAAWRAFWVGLGASAVLITQSLLAPAPVPRFAEPFEQPVATPVEVKRADPTLSLEPFDSNRGKAGAGVRNQS